MVDLKGKVALVTGATSGIGQVTAEYLAGGVVGTAVPARRPYSNYVPITRLIYRHNDSCCYPMRCIKQQQERQAWWGQHSVSAGLCCYPTVGVDACAYSSMHRVGP